MATTRGTIMGLVDTALKTIAAGATYTTNLGSKVYEWRAAPLDDATSLPACSYRDTLSTRFISTNVWLNTINLEITVFANTAAVVRSCVGDLIICIGANKTWGGNAISSQYVSEDTGVEQHNKLVFISRVSFAIQYQTTYWTA